MSKAFTRESDDASDESLSSIRPQLPPGTKNHITPAGSQRLRDRLAATIEQKRHHALRSADAGASPDPEQRRLETEIRRLQQLLDSVVITQPPKEADRDRICFGAAVTVRHGNQEQALYRFVGVEEMDLDRGEISWLSPLARALRSRRVGDIVRFQSPAGQDTLTILAIEYRTK